MMELAVFALGLVQATADIRRRRRGVPVASYPLAGPLAMACAAILYARFDRDGLVLLALVAVLMVVCVLLFGPRRGMPSAGGGAPDAK